MSIQNAALLQTTVVESSLPQLLVLKSLFSPHIWLFRHVSLEDVFWVFFHSCCVLLSCAADRSAASGHNGCSAVPSTLPAPSNPEVIAISSRLLWRHILPATSTVVIPAAWLLGVRLAGLCGSTLYVGLCLDGFFTVYILTMAEDSFFRVRCSYLLL